MIIDDIVILEKEVKNIEYLIQDSDGNYVDLSNANLTVEQECLYENQNVDAQVIGDSSGFKLQLQLVSNPTYNIPCWLVVKQDGTKVLARIRVYAIKEADLR